MKWGNYLLLIYYTNAAIKINNRMIKSNNKNRTNALNTYPIIASTLYSESKPLALSMSPGIANNGNITMDNTPKTKPNMACVLWLGFAC